VLLGAVLLWDVFFRGQLGILVSFLEEYWARNLGHLFVSPLRPAEWVGSLIVMSMIRVLVGTLPAALLAIPFFGYSIFDMGLPLILFFVLLTLLGWAIGLMIIAVVMVNGLGAESLAWLAVFLLSPISAVYYPVSVLPVWLQYVAWGLPTSHVFEGMRTLVLSGRVDWAEARTAFLLDLVYIALGALAFLTAFRAARREGKLLGLGE
jgi:ABC-2 type transport system permease protein